MRKKYSSPEIELIEFSLSYDVLGASTNPTDVPENPGSGGNEGIEGDL